MKRKKMTIREAKKMSIEHLLKLLGIAPVKRYTGYGMYYAFDRKESTPSLKIDYSKNLYYDFGASKGGDIISLVQLMNTCSVSEALEFLNNSFNLFSFHQQPKKLPENTEVKNYQIRKVKKLENLALLNYLKSRCIKIEVAKKHCQEIYYTMNSKNYFAICFKNNSEGYEIRNKYFKGCLEKKDFTLLKNNADSVLIFEGFFDFLSYLSLNYLKEIKADFIILNSINMIEKTENIFKKYTTVFSFLDNDPSGKKGLETVKKNHKNVIDMSFIYKGFNDLNAWFMEKGSC